MKRKLSIRSILLFLLTGMILFFGLEINGLKAFAAETEIRAEEEEVAIKERDWAKYSNSYSYEKMSAAEKAFYDLLYAQMMEYLTTNISVTKGWGYYTPKISIEGLTTDEALKVVSIFYNANPQFYFMRSGINYSSETDTSVSVIIYEEFADGNVRAETTNQIFDIVDAWAAEIKKAGKTRYLRVNAANELLCSKLQYEKAGLHQSIYSTFIEGKTVCEGYFLGFSLLMNYLGVPTVTVDGCGHAWNKVLLDNNRWYAVDVTWNDNTSNHTLYLNRADDNLFYRDSNKIHQASYPEYYPVTDTEDYYGEDTEYVIRKNEQGSYTIVMFAKGSIYSWKHDAKGWWVEDPYGLYPKDRWLMIEGVWYYFKPNGYMAANEYIDGYWLNKNGSWTYKRKAKWHKYKGKWWYGDSSGWYAANQKLRIDGVLYTFEKEGYLVE